MFIMAPQNLHHRSFAPKLDHFVWRGWLTAEASWQVVTMGRYSILAIRNLHSLLATRGSLMAEGIFESFFQVRNKW
jgi:hypothetical protein